MPYAYQQYTGNGSTATFTVPFPYLLRSHVRLYYGLNLVTGGYQALLVDGTNYNWANGSTVQLTVAPPNGTVLTIRRETPTTSRLVDWSDGSSLSAADMDTADLQNFYAIQEHRDFIEGLTITPTANVADNSITANKLSTDAVTTQKIADNSITANKLSTDAVTTSKLADNTITSQKIVNGAVVDAHIDSVTGIAASKMRFTQAGTAAVTRTVDSKLKDVVSVKDFGIGSGASDDTTKIQALLNEVFARGGGEIIFDSNNNYLVSETILIPSNLVLRFTGTGFVTLTDTTTYGAVFVTIGTDAVPTENIVIYNPRVDAGGFGYPLNDGENGIGGAKCKNIQIYGGTIKNCRRGSYSPAGAGGKGIQFEEGVENILVDGTTISNCTIGAETGGVVDLVGPPSLYRRYRGVQYKNLRIYNCDRVISVIHSSSPLDATPNIGLVQISNILAYNCGRESVAGTEKTFGAIVLDRASNVSMTNVCIANSPSYGDLGAVIRQPRGTNCIFDVTFFGNADALVLHSVGVTGYGGGDTCENNTYRIAHIGTTGYAVSGAAGQSAAIFKNSYDMQLDTVSTGLVDPNVAFSTLRCRFLSESKNASVEGQADALVAASNAFQTQTHRTAGTLSISATGTDKISTNANGRLLIQHAANDNVVVLSSDATSGFGANIAALLFSGYSPNNQTAKFLYMADTTTARAEIRSNGGLANFQANNINLSDRNVKKDITLASNTWDCIKEWEIVNYRYKDQLDDSDFNLGVIAQQIAETCPEVVTVFEAATDDKPEKLGVKEQQMYWMAIKALQEAQVRIEALEAKVAAMENA